MNKRTFDYTKKINPDLILVSGTSLIKEDLLQDKSKNRPIKFTYGLITLYKRRTKLYELVHRIEAI